TLLRTAVVLATHGGSRHILFMFGRLRVHWAGSSAQSPSGERLGMNVVGEVFKTDEVALDTSGVAGHPRGLMTLFFTEMWERFSYYGMRAFLVLFMVTPVASGGLGFDDARAGVI